MQRYGNGKLVLAMNNEEDVAMKLYMHPVRPLRPVRMLIAENGIKCDEEMVDILTGAHYQEPYASLNPNRHGADARGWRSPPDGRFGDSEISRRQVRPSVLSEGLKKRAKVNEVMDWLNTQLYRDFGYGLVYPQLFPHHKRRSDEAHAGAVAWGQQGAKNWLQILNDHWIGPKNQYLCGMNSPLPTILAPARIDRGTHRSRFLRLSQYQAVAREHEEAEVVEQVNEVFNGFVAANKGKEFVRA